MKIAIMQPYFFSYLGYYQLIHSVDKFIIYDNIKYTKRSWINRNRILLNGEDKLFTIPLKSDKDDLNVNQRYLSKDSKKECVKILAQIRNSYYRSRGFEKIYPMLNHVFMPPEMYQPINLFDYVYNSILFICSILSINTKIIISSTINIDHNLKSEKKVIGICNSLDANTYINSKGGKNLYNYDNFKKNKIVLKFLETNDLTYYQLSKKFIPYLSIIDVLMFNGISETKNLLNEFQLK